MVRRKSKTIVITSFSLATSLYNSAAFEYNSFLHLIVPSLSSFLFARGDGTWAYFPQYFHFSYYIVCFVWQMLKAVNIITRVKYFFEETMTAVIV